MLLAGGQGSRLYALTQNVAKPSVPFGGKYRIIDFPLSNCANSGIDTVGVLTQYRPLQLNSYIGSGQPWDLDVSDGGVYILPPYQSAGEKGSWFSGTANAIYQNIGFIESYDPKTCSSSPATIFIRWTIPPCCVSILSMTPPAPSPCSRSAWQRPRVLA